MNKAKKKMTIPTCFYMKKVWLGGKHSGAFHATYVYHSFRGISGSVIAISRDDAKRKVRKLHTDAEFYW